EVTAYVGWRRVKRGQRAEERSAFGHGRVVDFIVAVERPDALERRSARGGIDRNTYGCIRFGAQRSGEREEPGEPERETPRRYWRHRALDLRAALTERLHCLAFDGESLRVPREIFGKTPDVARVRHDGVADALGDP